MTPPVGLIKKKTKISDFVILNTQLYVEVALGPKV